MDNKTNNVSTEDYNEVKECIYKDERYSVRDNGSIMRHQREGKPVRKNDNKFTFGKKNTKTGYMEFCSERVHRIVATAFHGQAPSDQHVVDHKDTNRCNNRPENLQWVTRLENALNNPITRARIENICGSIEVFLADPSVLRGHENADPNFSWMRAVTPEEARISRKKLMEWAKNPSKSKGEGIDEWVFRDTQRSSFDSILFRKPAFNKDLEIREVVSDTYKQEEETTLVDANKEEKYEPVIIQSLTPNAVQLNWKNPEKFLCCPQHVDGNPLEAYMANLEEGKLFCSNDWGESHVLRFGMPDADNLYVMCSIQIGWKTHAITHITYKDGVYYHNNVDVLDIGDEPDELFDFFIKQDKEGNPV